MPQELRDLRRGTPGGFGGGASRTTDLRRAGGESASPQRAYGEFGNLNMTDEEYEGLVRRFGKEGIDRTLDQLSREANENAPANRISPAGKGSILANLRRGEKLTLRGGGAEGLGAYIGATPEEGFAPVEEEVAFVPPTIPEEGAIAAPEAAPEVEIGKPGWAKAQIQKADREYEGKVTERKKIVDDIAQMGGDIETTRRVLKKEGLDNLKEPKHEKWLVEMAAETPSTAELESAAMVKWSEGQQLTGQEEILVRRKTADPMYGQATRMVMQDPDTAYLPVKERLAMINEIYNQMAGAQAGDTGGGIIEPSGGAGVGADGLTVPPAPVGAPVPAPAGGARELDEATVGAIMAEAGGDPERARQIARERGYSF